MTSASCARSSSETIASAIDILAGGGEPSARKLATGGSRRQAGPPAPVLAEDWKKLGTREVTDRIDHDHIVVGADEGRFAKLQLRASRSPVRLRRVVIVFGDGNKQTIERNFVIRKGDRSPVLDLHGGKRIIRRVAFTYDEASLKKKRAKVTLWGR